MINQVHKSIIKALKQGLENSAEFNAVRIVNETENFAKPSIKILIGTSRQEKLNFSTSDVFLDFEIYFFKGDKLSKSSLNNMQFLLNTIFSNDIDDISVNNIEIDTSDEGLICNLDVSYIQDYFDSYNDKEFMEEIEMRDKHGT